jgi:hypothetical protein
LFRSARLLLVFLPATDGFDAHSQQAAQVFLRDRQPAPDLQRTEDRFVAFDSRHLVPP